MKQCKVYLTSTGCYIVYTETNHIAAYLTDNGYDIVNKVEDAEAIILTTCAVTENAAETTYKKAIWCIEKRRDGVPLYIVGCYNRVERQKMEHLLSYENVVQIPEVKGIENEFLGTNSWPSITYNDFFSHPFSEEYSEQYKKEASLKFNIVKKLFTIFDRIFKKETLFYYNFINGHLYNPDIQRTIWPVIAAKGCTHACTYCAVRIGRGKYTSKPISSVLNEVKKGLDNGYKRILLIGDELGPYGVDLKNGTSLSMLLDALNSEEFPVSFGFWYIDAFELMEVKQSLLRLAEKGKICFIGITIQHGSERILDLMNRHYSVSDTMDTILMLRKYPEIIIATQFMVGFPTETEEDFKKSYALVEKGCFDQVEVFEFSPRPRTKAAKMPNDVPSSVKNDRARRLRKLVDQKKRKRFLNHIIHSKSGNIIQGS